MATETNSNTVIDLAKAAGYQPVEFLHVYDNGEVINASDLDVLGEAGWHAVSVSWNGSRMIGALLERRLP